MSKSKIVAMMVLIVFAMGIFLVGDAVAGERGKVANREVFFLTTFQSLKGPDIAGHTLHLVDAKAIGFTQKWGISTVYMNAVADVIKGESTNQGYNQHTFPDGSTTVHKWDGNNKGKGASAEGTWTYIKGTGKFEGIQGGGTWKSYPMAPDQWYTDVEGEYTLPLGFRKPFRLSLS
jgi:hypothetical protein